MHAQSKLLGAIRWSSTAAEAGMKVASLLSVPLSGRPGANSSSLVRMYVTEGNAWAHTANAAAHKHLDHV